MKVIECKQGDATWRTERLGRPTGSKLHRIITPKTLKPSAGQDKLIAELVCEWALQMPFDDFGNGWTNRGTEQEDEGRSWYAFENDIDVQRVGFITDDTGQIGCSPDGLIGDSGMIEIKCYEAKHHVCELLNPDMDVHKAQIQGSLLITNRQWCDRIFYNPVLPSLVIRIERDEDFIFALKQAIFGEGGFIERLEAAKRKIVELGFDPYREPVNPLDPDPTVDILEVLGGKF